MYRQKMIKLLKLTCVVVSLFLLYRICLANVFRILSPYNNRNSRSDYYLDNLNGMKGIVKFEGKNENRLQYFRANNAPLCPERPPKLTATYLPKFDELNPPTLKETSIVNPKVTKGGSYAPKDCQARYKVAIIIPLRGRETHFRSLMSHMHPLWQRQQIDYTVYVITQGGNTIMNKARLLNIGFTEASKDRNYDCYVFHDVDLLAMDDQCLYHCSKSHPRHISKRIDKFSFGSLQYSLVCHPVSLFFDKVKLFGGVTMMTREQFLEVNGYSNLYWGWGGEDDDMYLRLWNRGYETSHPEDDVCRFHMIKHERERSNVINTGRHAMIYYSMDRMDKDGLNTLRYKILSYEHKKLYTNITVYVGEPAQRMREFISTNVTYFTECTQRLPWN